MIYLSSNQQVEGLGSSNFSVSFGFWPKIDISKRGVVRDRKNNCARWKGEKPDLDIKTK
jgi:hypothetical protein